MSATFTAVLGVAGRPQLKNMLDSLKRNAGPGDQVIVVVDAFEQGRREDVQALVRSYGPQFEGYHYDAGYHFLGAEQMNFAFRHIVMTGTHVLALADDDVLVDGAFDTYREYCERDMTRPLLPRFLCPFGIDFSTGGIDPSGRCILWDIPRMARVRITSAIVAPKQFLQMWPTKLDPCADYDWMQSILDVSPPPVWLDYVSIIARPETRGDEVLHRGIWQCDVCSTPVKQTWGYVEDGVTEHCGVAVRTAATVVGAAV